MDNNYINYIYLKLKFQIKSRKFDLQNILKTTIKLNNIY
jgi:hypothetical protein